MKISAKVIVTILISGLLTGCLPSPFYQKQEAIPNNAWNFAFRPVFKFDITDSTAKYYPYIIIQHSQAYSYSNLWLWLYIKTPGDSLIKKERLNLTLAAPDGRWLGRGLGAIYEERIAINLGESVKLKKPGTYEIMLEQNMRKNPLPEILHIGMRVQKVVAGRY
jgi:gliding motility-associated lipoprotein GldH